MRLLNNAGVPSNLVTLFEKNSHCWKNFEKENFSNLLNEFYDVFSHDVIARNCKFGEHAINVKDSSLIKVPHHIPLQMRKEINKKLLCKWKDKE